jgi:hypothetical protein
VFGLAGEPLVRIDTTPASATIRDGTGRTLRTLSTKGGVIAIDNPQQTITGTHDFVLAALIAAQELEPEVRMLAACDRVLQKEP